MPRARYKQLVDRFADEIRSGQLPPGTQLPTHRQLAAEQRIALVTATRVYAELEQMGLVSGETGRGTFVRETALPPGHGIDQPPATEGMVDLNFNSPSIPGQSNLLRQALRQLSISGDLESLLHYQPHGGRRHERALLARHFEARGLNIDADQLLIVSGAQQGLAATAMSLLQPGDVVAVDALTYPGFKVLAEVQRLELLPIPVSDDGPDLQSLAQRCQQRRVKAVYSMPTLHNPLGWVMNSGQRQQLIAIARQHNLLIIEDAAYAFLAETPPPPLFTLAPERTVYISGLSKSVATGLRIGCIVAPVHYIPLLERTIRATTWNTPALMTAIAYGWIADGTVAQLESEKRRDASARQAIARTALAGLDYVAHPASYFIWLRLPEDARTDLIVMALINARISVSGAEPFAVTDNPPHAIRLALGSVDTDTLTTALQQVREIIGRYLY
ncbi:aminotransferase-like domain-containing protein [Amphritea pacifica]|uniref:PLP-dependent aminotransferase family protein n=1 Tax=Amphritea pacifica TaxID=2811233 RepID=A0ABS2W3E8_9GAMM|nr:PLP-dependent aminotransferase family protein [Amphritea pacifica]MBN0986236.1 PLP-dependent aminotransferase family protein [Amphritea pacifica]